MPPPETNAEPRIPRTGRRRRLRSTLVTLVLGSVLFTVGAVGLDPPPTDDAPDRPSRLGGAAGEASLREPVEALRERLRHLPNNPVGWAHLGMAYVQQARTTADPTTYARGESALRKSLKLQPADNFQAETGMGALASARHDFPSALAWARKATATNPSSPAAHGVLADAYTQLGRYEASYRAVQRMTDLRPDAASLARASYTWELRGDTRRARELMRRSLQAASTGPERSFARTHLALLALETGDRVTALREANAGLRAAPRDPALLEARARTHAALGKPREAVDDYTTAIAIAPLPQYLLGLGELHESLGRQEQAETLYGLLRAQDRLRTASGGTPDVDAILFEADHGDPDKAVVMCRHVLRGRPFIAVHDACAWALHRAGSDEQALEHAGQALALGTRSAPFHYHRARIHHALGDLDATREDLDRALAIDPHFHPLHATEARTMLRRIDGTR
ncbi:tetratricopeptide repeat protein [Streptomyces sp. ISL-96]|uniref:tetratricopeptide repeat protein n=1 Tax=Streptomyces sp. ISL-96 TaxID=2819191 RepID=UPI001BEAFB3B|nr:tetratricopeptide repeat protein [Streptomyces sp. ISL-96]MBT2487186.1 tetratricopeptide repeat protein [Streptomyces sp. ISL-96]